jgi:hypothetical protein
MKDLLGNNIRKQYSLYELSFFEKYYIFNNTVYQIIRLKRHRKLECFIFEVTYRNIFTNKIKTRTLTDEAFLSRRYYSKVPKLDIYKIQLDYNFGKNCPMTVIGNKFQEIMRTSKKLHVTNMYVNSKTYERLADCFFVYLTKKPKSKKLAQQSIGWYQLQLAPCNDLDNSKNLATDFIYYYV